MKKLLVLFCVLALTAGFAPNVAAQFYWEVLADFNSGLFARGFPTGERAERTLTIGGTEVANIHPNNPLVNSVEDGFTRGNFTHSAGYLDFFSYGSGQWLRGNELRMTIGFKRNGLHFHSMVSLDTLVRPDLSDGTGIPNELGPDHSLVQAPNGARTVNWGDVLRFSWEEYFFRGTIGAFTTFIGNTPDRGKTNAFNTLTDDVLRTIRVEYFGVITPDFNADFLDNGQDTNNFMRSPRVRATRTFGANTDDLFGFVDTPYLMIGMDINSLFSNFHLPLTFQIAVDPGNNSGINSGGGNDSRNDFDFIKMNGAVRLSGESIADWVTFDLIYRFKGGDPNILNTFDAINNPGGVIQPDGLGIIGHTFGAYANILGIRNLGIGVGYSGYVKVFEDDNDSATHTISRRGPFFNGFDLRLQYTGIDRLVITSASNFSFGRIQRSKEEPIVAIGVLGSPLPLGTSQQWVGLYNALGADFQLNDNLTLSFQMGHRYGIITTINTPVTGGSITVTRSRHQLGGGGFIAYQINRHLRLQTGFVFRYLNDAYTNNTPGSQLSFAGRDASGGMFEIAVPLRVRMVFN